MSILERHADKWTPEPNTGCYLWTGAIGARPMVGIAGNKIEVMARLVCEETYGSAPEDKPLALHNTPNGCVGGLCVAPHHLRWGSKRDNALDEPAERRREWSLRGYQNRTTEQRNNHRDKPRNMARLAGERTYISGKTCKNGHVGPRFVSTGDCIECRAEWNARRTR